MFLFQIPLDFEYTARSVPGQGCDPGWFEDELPGCSCTQECSAGNNCSCLLGAEDNYSADGLLLPKQSGAPVLECHEGCACSPTTCRNRVLQHGVLVRIKVFREDAGKGASVRAVEAIEKDRFVCEYAGEIIGKQEVERRAETSHRHNYTLTVKEHSDSGVQCTFIDPRLRGNLARFINHSCQPNLQLVPIRIGIPVPVIGLFTNRAVAAGEELCYDYGPSALSEPRKRCLCGSVECRGYLPASATATE